MSLMLYGFTREEAFMDEDELVGLTNACVVNFPTSDKQQSRANVTAITTHGYQKTRVKKL